LCRGIQIDSFVGSKRNLCFQASFQIRGIFNKDVTALDGSLEEEFNEMPFRARNINFQPTSLALLKFAFGLQMLSSNFMNQPRNCCAQQWLRLLHFEIAGIGTNHPPDWMFNVVAAFFPDIVCRKWGVLQCWKALKLHQLRPECG
jgi:hypothetical protein